jgi:hypothetical protein
MLLPPSNTAGLDRFAKLEKLKIINKQNTKRVTKRARFFYSKI